jgi:hypothetical protein
VSAQDFAGFLTRLGHRVVETSSGAWYDANRFFLLGLPTHDLRTPSGEEMRQIVRGGVFGARFTTPIGAPGKLSYQIVCDDPRYGLDSLSSNTRSKIRRGLKRCEIRLVEPAEVAVHGVRAHEDTLARQDRAGLLGGASWQKFWDAVAATPGMEVWGAWVDEKLAAFLVTVDFGDCVEFLFARSRDDCLPAYPNNALLFHATEEMLVRRGIREITFGIESLEPVGPLDQFKFSMGFRTKPLRQRVVFHPAVAMALRSAAVRALFHRWAGAEKGAGVFWRKASGLLRFAEEAGI